MRVLWAYVERYGRPQSVYTDKASLFQPALAPGWKGEEPGPKSETQMGRAFRELGIEWIAAHSPQAKGRIERCFGTLQDRLVKGLRRAGAGTLEEANGYLEREFLTEWNERFGVQAGSGADAQRSLSEVNASIPVPVGGHRPGQHDRGRSAPRAGGHGIRQARGQMSCRS